MGSLGWTSISLILWSILEFQKSVQYRKQNIFLFVLHGSLTVYGCEFLFHHQGRNNSSIKTAIIFTARLTELSRITKISKKKETLNLLAREILLILRVWRKSSFIPERTSGWDVRVANGEMSKDEHAWPYLVQFLTDKGIYDGSFSEKLAK